MEVAGRVIAISNKPKLIPYNGHWICVGDKDRRYMIFGKLSIPVIAYGKDPAMAFRIWKQMKP